MSGHLCCAIADKKIIIKKIQALKNWRDRNPAFAISGTVVKENSTYPLPSQELLVYEFVLSSKFFVFEVSEQSSSKTGSSHFLHMTGFLKILA